MANRSKARELVVQMLYQTDLNSDVDGKMVKEMIFERLNDTDLADFGWSLFAGAWDKREELDKKIVEVAQNWKLSRMAPTDRNVLRMGAYELFHTNTPSKVAVDEAVKVAKKFGGPNSPSFVNGILDKLIPENAKEE